MTKGIRWLAVMAAMIALAPGLADARAGGGSGSGSKGSKTGQAAPPTQTAPQSKPIERSTTPQQTQPQGGSTQQAQAPRPATAAPGGGFFSRNPFLSGLMGGMLGAGLVGMLFGGGLTGGLGGAAGFLGLLLQLALIGGLVWLAVRFFRGRSAPQPAYAGGNPGNAMPRQIDAPPAAARTSAAPAAAGAIAASTGLAITAEDYQAFEAGLVGIQDAYSQGDLGKLRGLVTPEMLGYFSEELAANASRGVANRIEAVKLEQGDLAEAWSENGMDYATVAMRFSMIDTMRRLGDGSIESGNDKVRTEATEVWTFVRSRGGHWILSAIQQT